MVNTNPIELKGNWAKGYSLDLHTTSSEFVGYSEYGYARYNTKYSQLGELILRLKYRNDKTVINDIVDVVSDFLSRIWKIVDELNFLIPVPPSKTDRKYQPVIEIVEKLSSTIHVPICIDSLVKSKVTQELKGIKDFEKRKEILGDAFDVRSERIRGKNILLVDDLYRSGATLQIITGVLYNKGKVKNVYVLTVTKTRSNR